MPLSTIVPFALVAVIGIVVLPRATGPMMVASAGKLAEQNVRVIVMAFPRVALSHYNRGL